MEKMTVNEMKAQINALNAQIFKVEKKIEDENTIKLMEEVANFFGYVGKGYVEEDYYAPARYYSEIPGVKNLRLKDEGIIYAKVTSPKGLLLPETVDIGNEVISIVITFSSKYSEKIDY